MSENSKRDRKPSRKPATDSTRRPDKRTDKRTDVRGERRTDERKEKLTDTRGERTGDERKEKRGAPRGDARGKDPRKHTSTRTSNSTDRKGDPEKKVGRGRKRPALSLTNYATMRLNKYLSNAGICSRREADELIKTGLVEVDGKVVTEMGYQVKDGEVVKYAGEKITPEMPAYFLLNKPKNYTSEMRVTTDGKNAMALLRGIGKHSVAPIGKMDRTTSGLMLYTNDGEMTGKLANPKGLVKKIYHVHLDKNLKTEDMDRIREGVSVDGSFIKANDISYVGTEKDKKQLGIEITNNRNKAVRLLLKELGYYVVKLDRVMYAGLTKKDLPRGKWRKLTEQEVINLKMLK